MQLTTDQYFVIAGMLAFQVIFGWILYYIGRKDQIACCDALEKQLNHVETEYDRALQKLQTADKHWLEQEHKIELQKAEFEDTKRKLNKERDHNNATQQRLHQTIRTQRVSLEQLQENELKAAELTMLWECVRALKTNSELATAMGVPLAAERQITLAKKVESLILKRQIKLVKTA